MYNPKAFNEGVLEDQDGHCIYFAQYGNKNGEVIVSLHGGPGSQSKSKHVNVFDLEKYQVVMFDQRGCGNSTPQGSIVENTTHKLVADIERLRERIGVENWHVSGGSWGSTLALAYAETFPQRVKSLLLSAIFLADKTALDWAYSSSDGVAMLFSDVWNEREKQLDVYSTTAATAAKILLEKLVNSDVEEQKKITSILLNWEGNLMTSNTDVSYTYPEDVTDKDIASVKIYLHFELNNFFLEENQLLNNMQVIKDIPMVVVHGRHDILCPFKGAWDLHQKHLNSKLVALPQSNHKFSADGEIARKYIFAAFLSGLK